MNSKGSKNDFWWSSIKFEDKPIEVQFSRGLPDKNLKLVDYLKYVHLIMNQIGYIIITISIDWIERYLTQSSEIGKGSYIFNIIRDCSFDSSYKK